MESESKQTRDVFLNTTGQGVKGQEPSVEFKMKKVCDVEPKCVGMMVRNRF